MRRPPYRPRGGADARQAEARGKSRRAVTAALLLAGAGLVVAGGLAATLSLPTGDHPRGLPPGADAVACTAAPSATTSMLFDVSEPYATPHRSRALEASEEEALDLPVGGRLLLNVMKASDPDGVQPVLSLCAPPKAEASDWLRGTAHAERLRRERYLAPVHAQVEAAIASAAQTVSPIIETIAALTRDPSFDVKVPNRRLVIVSDMLQNDRLPIRARRKRDRLDRAGGYTQYASGDISASFRRSRLARRIRPDLSGASVVIHYLVRAGVAEYPTAAHVRFWRDWLRAVGARQVEFRGIPNYASIEERRG